MADKPKVALIGAGSRAFGLTVATDLLTFPELDGLTISLMDINKESLELTASFVKRLVQERGLKARVEVTTNRREAIADADYVVASIRSGGMQATKLDLEIPAKYGIEQGVADTLGPGGIFYGLKNASTLLGIARDIEEASPNAVFINYTNPMAINSWVILASTRLKYVGLCHSIPGTARELANYMGIPYEELSYTAAGINHMAWFVELKWNGVNAYPLLNEKLDERVYTDPNHPAYRDLVRVEVFKSVGYYSAEDSNHLSEYLPYFRKDLESLKKYRILNHEERLSLMEKREERKKQEAEKLKSAQALPFNRSGEFGPQVIYAMETGTTTKIYGNVKNTGLIPNLPYGSVVELPVFVDKGGFHPVYVGELPPQLAALNRMDISAQELAVKAILEGSKERVFHALLADPLTSSHLSIREIRKMADEMLEAEAPYLPPLN
ncbi:MAG: alpha-galactosidase [Thermoprotei archaeon]